MFCRTAIGVFLAACALSSASAEPKQAATPKESKEELLARREASRAEYMKEEGGDCVVPGSQKGKIRVINGQQRVSNDELGGLLKYFLRKHRSYDFSVVTGGAVSPANAEEERKRTKSNVAVFIVDDKGIKSSMLIAPEECWAIVNVAKLGFDNPTKPYLAARVRKEVLRALGYMTAGSTYKATIVAPVSSVKDLDEIALERYPMDVTMRMDYYLRGIGVTPCEVMSYRDVLSDGHDVAPTNDFQKVIYDEIKAKKSGRAKVK